MSAPEGVAAASRRSELATRWIVAGVGLPVVAVVIWFGGWVLAGLLALAAAAGARELCQMAREGGARPFTVLSSVGAGALVLAAAFGGTYRGTAEMAWGVLILLALIAFCAAVWSRGPEGRPLSSASVTVAAATYVGGALALAVLLRELPTAGDVGAVGGGPLQAALPLTAPSWTGSLLLIFPLVVSWLGDTAAYFGGRRWGRRKLIPRVSPKKTVEGAVAGLVASVVAAGVYAPLALGGTSFAMSLPVALAVGLVLGAAAQVGDLAISVLKREAGVKDSGRVLPGHGGILDRLDSLFTAMPAAYLLFWAVERGIFG